MKSLKSYQCPSYTVRGPGTEHWYWNTAVPCWHNSNPFQWPSLTFNWALMWLCAQISAPPQRGFLTAAVRFPPAPSWLSKICRDGATEPCSTARHELDGTWEKGGTGNLWKNSWRPWIVWKVKREGGGDAENGAQLAPEGERHQEKASKVGEWNEEILEEREEIKGRREEGHREWEWAERLETGEKKRHNKITQSQLGPYRTKDVGRGMRWEWRWKWKMKKASEETQNRKKAQMRLRSAA